MRRSLATAVAAAIAATALLAGSASPAPNAYPGRNGLIAFASSRDGLGPGIFTMHTDGTGLVRLTGPPPEAVGASFSPDGRTLAFARISDSAPPEVWLADANGTHLRPLLHDTGAGSSSAPAWSPDGRWIAFVTGAAEHPRIALVRPDGSDRHDLVDGAEPSWSPDAKQIVFTRVDHLPGLWAIGVDGRGLRRLHDGGSPAWSPDGRRIAFDKKPCASCMKQLYVMDGNGDHARRLTTNAATETGVPAWSPDGKLIAFGECCHQLDPADGPVPSLDVVRPDGSGRRALYRTTNEEFGVDEPAWSPDGRRIVFDYGGYELRVLNADGSGVRPVFPGVAGGDGDPQWSPDGRHLAFASAGGVAVMDANGAHRRHAGVLQTATWSPDGRRIAGENLDNGIDVVTLATGRGTHLLVDSGPGTPTDTDPAWSAKGTLAYLADGDVALYTFGAHPATR